MILMPRDARTRTRARTVGAVVLTALLCSAGRAEAQVSAPGLQVIPAPRQLSVVAGQTSAPVELRVVASEAARVTRSFAFAVQFPQALVGHAEGQPARVALSLAPGQTEGRAQLRFLTRPTAPAGTHVVSITAGPDGPSTEIALAIEAPTGTPGTPAPPPGVAQPTGTVQVSFRPARLDVCEGGEAVRGTIRLQGVDGYRGTPNVSWATPPGIAVTPPAPAGQPLPPDREIPFEVAAPRAAPGSHPLRVAVVDPASGFRTEARAEVVVEAAGVTPRATPAALSLRQGGPEVALAVTVDAGRCSGGLPLRVDVTEAPHGLLLSPASGLLATTDARAVLRVRAPMAATVGRQTIGIEIVQAGRTGEVRRELRVPVVIEAAGPAELARAPRIERVEPAVLGPGERATLELTGRNLGAGVTIAFEPAGVEPVLPPVFHSPTRATVEVYVPQGTREGIRTVVASSGDGRMEGPGELRIRTARLPAEEPAAPPEEPLPDAPEDPTEPPEEDPGDDPEDEPADLPDVHRLDFGGFIVAVTGISDPDPESFGGQGVLEEFVFAGRVQSNPVTFDFSDLSLQATAIAGLFEVVSGQALFDKAVNLSLPLEVTGLAVQLQRMVLGTGDARIDGRVFLPFTDASVPVDDILMGGVGGGAGPGGTSPGGFALIPAYSTGDQMMPVSGGGAVLSYQGIPITGGSLASTLITQATTTPFDAGGLQIAALPTAPTGSVTFTDQPLSPEGDFTYTGIAQIESHPMGESGVSFKAQQGLSVVVDLSRATNPNQAALNSAYLAWGVAEDAIQGYVLGGGAGGMNFADVASPPTVPHTSPQWMGLVFLDAELAAGGIGIAGMASHVAWVAPGFQTLLAQSFGGSSEATTAHGWEIEVLNAALGVKNSILVDAGALGDVYLPFFGEKMRVILKSTNGGSPSMKAAGTVAHHYGHTVVIGEGGAFFWHEGALKLGFTDAQWAFNGNLDAPQPQAAPTGGLHPMQDVSGFAVEGYQTNLQFLKDNYQRKFHLKFLTLTADGGADLHGRTSRTLASVPALDFLNYPFLSGGASILLEQQGSRYTLGLRGNLELAGNLGGVQATTRYTVENGEEQEWTFTGSLDASIKVVHLDLEVAGEVDLTTKDLFFHANGGFTIEELFHFDATGAFGREGSTRYWFVHASMDLQGTPIVDTGYLAFYSFKGGLAHNLQAAASGTCGILDPVSFAQNANQCVDGSVAWTFLAGTVLAPSEAYGGDHTVHIDGTLMISSQGSVDILGQAWLMRSFSQGYSANAAPNAAAHIGVNKDRFVMTACVGPTGTSQGAPESAQTISCDGLEPLRYPQPVPVVEIRGWTGFLLDWSTHTYYLAVGHYGNKVEARFFGLAYRSGYMVLAYSPSVPASWLPPLAGGQVGFYAGRQAGYSWDFEYSWGVLCDNKVWANASLGSESNFFLEFVPFALYADVHYWVSMGVGAQICGIGAGVQVAGDLGASVYVSQQLGELKGSFSGRVRVCGANNCLNLIKIPDIGVNLTLWQA